MNKWKEIGISKCMDYYLFSLLLEDGVIVYNTVAVKAGGFPRGSGGYFDYHALEKLMGITFVLYRNGE